MVMTKSVSIIGAGVVGSAVGHLLRQQGYTIKGVVARRLASAKKAAEFIGEGKAGTDAVAAASSADFVLITTPDKAIKPTCDEIAAGGGFAMEGRGCIAPLVAHFSGALGSDVLGSARDAGARVASIHPLQSLASARQAVANLPGSYMSVEGDPSAMADCFEIVDALGGLRMVIPSGQKPLYHAGAAVASNYLVTVVDFAVTIYESLGMSRADAVKAVMPLVRGTVNNIERVGVPDALTGPIARGDVATVEGHIEVLAKTMPNMLSLYKELGRHTVSVGLAKGSLAKEDADRLMELFGR